MSKSRGNVVNPDDIVAEYGADSMRLFEMFMGPLIDTKPWSTRGVEGVHRFLNRVWRMLVGPDGKLHPAVREGTCPPDRERLLHQTIRKVTEDVDALAFNTAISQMMIFVNEFLNAEEKPRHAMEAFVLLLSPFAPHIAEELWELLGHPGSLAREPWPAFDEAKTKVGDGRDRGAGQREGAFEIHGGARQPGGDVARTRDGRTRGDGAPRGEGDRPGGGGEEPARQHRREVTAVARLSVIVLTLNEERNIRRCLGSVRWADEVVVVDSFSTDRTVAIAAGIGAKVIAHAYDSDLRQRDRGFAEATGEWLLVLDADEEVPRPARRRDPRGHRRGRRRRRDTRWRGW